MVPPADASKLDGETVGDSGNLSSLVKVVP
jgi:hypothetical protein